MFISTSDSSDTDITETSATIPSKNENPQRNSLQQQGCHPQPSDFFISWWLLSDE